MAWNGGVSLAVWMGGVAVELDAAQAGTPWHGRQRRWPLDLPGALPCLQPDPRPRHPDRRQRRRHQRRAPRGRDHAPASPRRELPAQPLDRARQLLRPAAADEHEEAAVADGRRLLHARGLEHLPRLPRRGLRGRRRANSSWPPTPTCRTRCFSTSSPRTCPASSARSQTTGASTSTRASTARRSGSGGRRTTRQTRSPRRRARRRRSRPRSSRRRSTATRPSWRATRARSAGGSTGGCSRTRRSRRRST